MDRFVIASKGLISLLAINAVHTFPSESLGNAENYIKIASEIIVMAATIYHFFTQRKKLK
jgi:hypothetical protein